MTGKFPKGVIEGPYDSRDGHSGVRKITEQVRVDSVEETVRRYLGHEPQIYVLMSFARPVEAEVVGPSVDDLFADFE